MTKNGFCRTKKIDQLTDKQTKYLIKLREEEPNKGYKGFENGLFIQKKRISFFHFKLSKWSDLKWDNRKKVKKKFAK